MIYWVFSVIIIFCGIFLAVIVYRNIAIDAAYNSLLIGNKQKSVSLIWAWATKYEIQAAHHESDELWLEGMMHEQEPKFIKLVNPLVLTIIVFVLCYQKYLRYGGLLEPGDCPNIPNCSNYLIGCLTRFSLIRAVTKGYIRTVHCSGKKEIDFGERF